MIEQYKPETFFDCSSSGFAPRVDEVDRVAAVVGEHVVGVHCQAGTVDFASVKQECLIGQGSPTYPNSRYTGFQSQLQLRLDRSARASHA